ncbi:hypothetical protein [Gloeothece verrucosa]|uniref:Uncharacterized protein n=1 Tax=Gloeothece verrucosa (strain PCC 7822) TaxID=497965 RepID=E0UNI1_GLOV7|nr:hypothetical protein [Gloeothece verrucosa]ADN18511.1 hypothetical protein Cyan7822_6865 [Gloeothece verrucosa PCC 7822]
MTVNAEIQQQRTSQIAPNLMALLKAKKISKSPDYSYDALPNITILTDEEHLITFDGFYLKLLDRQTGKEKMIATGTRNQETGDIDWKAHSVSLGLSLEDVEKYDNPSLIVQIKQTILEAYQQEQKISLDRINALTKGDLN